MVAAVSTQIGSVEFQRRDAIVYGPPKYADDYNVPASGKIQIYTGHAWSREVIDKLKILLLPRGEWDDLDYNTYAEAKALTWREGEMEAFMNSDQYQGMYYHHCIKYGEGFDALMDAAKSDDMVVSVRNCLLIDKRSNTVKTLRQRGDNMLDDISEQMELGKSMLQICKACDLQPLAVLREFMPKRLGYPGKIMQEIFYIAKHLDRQADLRSLDDSFTGLFEYHQDLQMFVECLKVDNQLEQSMQAKEIGRVFESKVEEILHEFDVQFIYTAASEYAVTNKFNGNSMLRPDFRLTGRDFIVNGVTLRWIECKAFCGGISNALDQQTIPQAKSYCEEFGPGAVLYEFGYTADHAIKVGNYGGFMHDVVLLDYHTLNELRAVINGED